MPVPDVYADDIRACYQCMKAFFVLESEIASMVRPSSQARLGDMIESLGSSWSSSRV